MTENRMKLGMMVDDLEFENRFLRARNERLMAEIENLEKQLRKTAKNCEKIDPED